MYIIISPQRSAISDHRHQNLFQTKLHFIWIISLNFHCSSSFNSFLWTVYWIVTTVFHSIWSLLYLLYFNLFLLIDPHNVTDRKKSLVIITERDNRSIELRCLLCFYFLNALYTYGKQSEILTITLDNWHRRYRNAWHKMDFSESLSQMFFKIVFLKISQFSLENTCVGAFFHKVAGLKVLPEVLEVFFNKKWGTGIFLWILRNFEEQLFL